MGCKTSDTDCIVSIFDTKQNQPATNKTFLFFQDAPFAPLIKAPAAIEAHLDKNGEARVHLPAVSGWARIDDNGVSYGTSLKPADISNGGRFQLYGPSSNLQSTNLFPSKFVLEIRKPALMK